MAGLRERLRGDRGGSLTEMLVVMMILGIVVATTASLTIGFQRTNAVNIARQDQVDMARTAVETMAKKVRTAVKPSQLIATCDETCTADAFVLAERFAVQFYANIDNQGNLVGPSRVTYRVATSGADAGKLIEKVQRPDSATPTSTGYSYCNAEATGASAACKTRLTTRTVATGIVTSGAAIFSYTADDGVPLTPPATGSLGATDLDRVLAIELTVKVQSTRATKAQPTTYIQRVLLPNAQAVINQEEEETP